MALWGEFSSYLCISLVWTLEWWVLSSVSLVVILWVVIIYISLWCYLLGGELLSILCVWVWVFVSLYFSVRYHSARLCPFTMNKDDIYKQISVVRSITFRACISALMSVGALDHIIFALERTCFRIGQILWNMIL